MRTQAQVEQLISSLYSELGKDPKELIQISPRDGRWDNALSYTVTRTDSKKAIVRRQDLDDNNNGNVKSSLTQFC